MPLRFFLDGLLTCRVAEYPITLNNSKICSETHWDEIFAAEESNEKIWLRVTTSFVLWAYSTSKPILNLQKKSSCKRITQYSTKFSDKIVGARKKIVILYPLIMTRQYWIRNFLKNNKYSLLNIWYCFRNSFGNIRQDITSLFLII